MVVGGKAGLFAGTASLSFGGNVEISTNNWKQSADCSFTAQALLGANKLSIVP